MSKTLGERLWKKIETPQGRAFISDRVTEMSDEEVINIVRVAVEWQEEGLKVLREFLKKHDKNPPPATGKAQNWGQK